MAREEKHSVSVNYNITAASRILGIDPNTFKIWVRKFGPQMDNKKLTGTQLKYTKEFIRELGVKRYGTFYKVEFDN